MYYFKDYVAGNLNIQQLSSPERDSWFYIERSHSLWAATGSFNKGFLFEVQTTLWALDNYADSNGTFIDIGAHAGMWTCKFAPHSASVIAFEPDNKSFCYLCANIALHNVENKVQQYKMAVGNTMGESIWHIRSEDGAGNGLTPIKDDNTVINTQKVKCITLDTINLDIQNKISLIKIDVEGGEYDVIKGGTQFLYDTGFPPIIFESWNPEECKSIEWGLQQREQLFSLINNMGYNIIPIMGDSKNFLAVHPSWKK